MNETSLSLIGRVQANSTAGWDRMVQLYEPLIMSWLRRADVADADAADLCQEVLSTLVREVNRFEHSGRTGAWRAWLRQITVHRVRQYWSRRRNHANQQRATHFLDHLADPASDLTREWDRRHDCHVIEKLLDVVQAEFQPTTTEAFRRTFVDRASPQEVAAELGLSVASVYTAKSRVLAFLRREAEGLVEVENR